MLKEFLTTAAVVALMAGPAYAQADQAGKGKADGSTTSSTMEKSDTGSSSAASGTSGSTPTQSGAGASTSTGAMTTGQDSSGAASSDTTTTTSQDSGAASSGSSMTTTQDSGTAASGAAATTGSTEAFLTDQSDGQWRAEKLIGANVKNGQDEDIGKIDDLVFSEEGRIQAAVVSVGGFLGIGAKNVALSWDQLQIRSSETGEEIMVSMTKEQLENAPAFKTLEDKKSEEAAANAQMQQGTTPPATGMGTSN